MFLSGRTEIVLGVFCKNAGGVFFIFRILRNLQEMNGTAFMYNFHFLNF